MDLSEWQPWKANYDAHSAPTIPITLSGDQLTIAGRAIARPKLLSDLRRLSTVAGHPIVVLIVKRAEIRAANVLMVEISSTGICFDVGCYLSIIGD